MKKIKNVNNNSTQIKALVEASAPKVEELSYGSDNTEITFKVYPVLPFSKRVEMIREIVDGVFVGEKDSVNTYVPEYLSFIQRVTVIKYYTDLVLPTKLDDIWLVLNYTPIFNDVVNLIGKDEVQNIFEAANKSIETYRSYLTTKTDVNSLMKKIGNILSDFEGMVPQEDIAEITSKIKEIPKGSSLQDIIGSLLVNKDVKANK